MTMLAPCRASSSTTALPMPLLPPVTTATFPFSVMMDLLQDDGRPQGQRRRGQRHDGGGAEHGDATAYLIEGDQAASHRGRDGGQLLLSEADRQRQEGRAAQAARAGRSPASDTAPCHGALNSPG